LSGRAAYGLGVSRIPAAMDLKSTASHTEHTVAVLEQVYPGTVAATLALALFQSMNKRNRTTIAIHAKYQFIDA
jgi:hypothetical protein